METTPRARLILRHLATSKVHEESLSELVRFSPVDGNIADRKAEARENAAAIEELIRKELVGLWVVDRWPTDKSRDAFPDLVIYPTDSGLATAERL
jgi:hypothetical protein